MSFDDDIRPIEKELARGVKALNRPMKPVFNLANCPEHWTNILVFGSCWRHNPDGSLKSTFTK